MHFLWACVSSCEQSAHTIEDGIHAFDRKKCIACGECVKHCLGNALTLYGKEITVDELLPILMEDKVFYDNSNGGITLSGGECLLYADFCAELLKKLKENGVHTAVDTCGFVSKDALDKVIPYTDIFLYDIKATCGNVHKKCTGYDNGRILDNLSYLDAKGCKIEIRIPYVPEWNSGEMEEIAVLLKTMRNITKIRLLPYHNYASSKYEALNMKNTLPNILPSESEMKRVRAIIKEIVGEGTLIIA